MKWKFTLFTLAAFVAACGEGTRNGLLETGSVTPSAVSMQFTSPLDAACPFCLVAGDTLIRTTGAPTEHQYTLSGDGFLSYTIQATQLGGPSTNPIVSLDGETIFSTSDFAKAKDGTLTKVLPADFAPHLLDASLRGGPGGKLIISVKPIPRPLAGLGLIVNRDPADSEAFFMADTTGAKLFAWRNVATNQLTTLAGIAPNDHDTTLVGIDARGLPQLVATPNGGVIWQITGYTANGATVIVSYVQNSADGTSQTGTAMLGGQVAAAILPLLTPSASAGMWKASALRAQSMVSSPPDLGAWLKTSSLGHGIARCIAYAAPESCVTTGLGYLASSVVSAHQADGWVDASALYAQVSLSGAACIATGDCFGLFALVIDKLEPKSLYIDPVAPIGIAGQPISPAIRVVVLNTDQRAMTHWSVRYRIVDGGGSVGQLGTTTFDTSTPWSDLGATATWYLGPVIGSQNMEISVPVWFSGRLSQTITAIAQPPYGTIHGTLVSDSNMSLAGVQVAALGTVATTAADGSFTLSKVGLGTVTLTFAGLPAGCTVTNAVSVTVTPGGTTTVGVTVTCVPQSTLLYSDDFSHGLTNWVSPDGGSWSTVNNELIGDYNIGCGSIGCSQTDLLLVDALQPGNRNWRLEVRSNRVEAYCCYNGGAQVNFAKFSVFVSSTEKDDFEVGGSWVPESATPATTDSLWFGLQAYYPWHWIGGGSMTVPTWQTDQWQTAALEKRGNQLTLFWNGIQIYTVTRAYSSSPKVGLHTYGKVRMDDFKLYALP